MMTLLLKLAIASFIQNAHATDDLDSTLYDRLHVLTAERVGPEKEYEGLGTVVTDAHTRCDFQAGAWRGAKATMAQLEAKKELTNDPTYQKVRASEVDGYAAVMVNAEAEAKTAGKTITNAEARMAKILTRLGEIQTESASLEREVYGRTVLHPDRNWYSQTPAASRESSPCMYVPAGR